MGDLTCGRHRAFVYSRGGARRLFELKPLTLCRWNRVRDDISRAEVVVGTADCCDLLDQIRTILHELHIYRNGKKVWEGPMVRLEYEWDQMRIFAEDVLWQATRTAVNPGFDNRYPNMGLVLDTVDQLLQQCYSRQNDPWNMLPGHLHPIRTPDEPKHSRVINRYGSYVWEELDKFAEDAGVDYTVVNRDIYYWDVHWEWKRLPTLSEKFISDRPRIVEYGNSLATRVFVTNGQGWAGIDELGADETARKYYGYVDKVIASTNVTDTEAEPDQHELLEWQRTARRALKSPSPTGIVVPDNTTLLPGSPWQIEDLIPGAWFKVTIERLCRKVTTWNRLQQVTIEEIAPRGEQISFSSATAPAEHHVLAP